MREAAPIAYYTVPILMLLLLTGGLLMILSVSTAMSLGVDGVQGYPYLRDQALAAALGLFLALLVWRVDYRSVRGISVMALGIVGLLLLMVLVPGVGREANGTTGWLVLGPVSIQPSEVARLAIVLAGATMLSTRRARSGGFGQLVWPFGAVAVFFAGLVVLQRDLGGALLIAAVAMVLLWLAGMKPAQWLAILGVGMGGAVALVFMADYRSDRLTAFLDPFADPLDKGFQLVQSLLAFGRGGWLGVGPGASVQKYSYLPEAHTDMIFAILGEEFGLVGVCAVIFLFAGLTFACFRLASRCCDPLGRYLIAGCASLIAIQAAVNIGGVMGALPLTGVPLPFMSFGRNNLLVVLVAVGLIMSVARSAPAPLPRREKVHVTDPDRRRRDRGAHSPRISHS